MEMQLWICLPILLCAASQGLLGDVGPGRSIQLLVHTPLVYPAYTVKLLHVVSTHQTVLEVHIRACCFETRSAMQEWGIHTKTSCNHVIRVYSP